MEPGSVKLTYIPTLIVTIMLQNDDVLRNIGTQAPVLRCVCRDFLRVLYNLTKICMRWRPTVYTCADCIHVDTSLDQHINLVLGPYTWVDLFFVKSGKFELLQSFSVHHREQSAWRTTFRVPEWCDAVLPTLGSMFRFLQRHEMEEKSLLLATLQTHF